MGYYSTLNAMTFKSRLNEQEMKAAWDDFVESQGNDDMYYLEIYEIKHAGDGQNYEIYMDDYFAKHYAGGALAEFICRVIEPEGYCKLEFGGDDGENWGWVILQHEVHPIEYEQYVCGQPLRSFVEDRLNLKQIEGVATCQQS